jgi:hypothetical protein
MNGDNNQSIISVTFICNRLYIYLHSCTKFVLLLRQCLILELDRIVVLQLTVQLVSITTKVVSWNPVHGEVYSIQYYVIKFVSDLLQVGGYVSCIRWTKTGKRWMVIMINRTYQSRLSAIDYIFICIALRNSSYF